MNEKVAHAIIKAKLVKFGIFTYTSGKKGPIYIDLRELPSYPKLFNDVTGELNRIIKSLPCDVVAGAETAGIPLSTAVSIKTRIPMIYVRKKPKGHGTGSQTEGVLKKGQKVILVDDLITYGTSKINFIKGIEKEGGIVKDVVVVLERGEKGGGRDLLERKGYNLHALITLKELMKYMIKKRKLTKKLQNSTINYLNDPVEWERKIIMHKRKKTNVPKRS